MTDPTKPKKPVDQKTLDVLAKGRAARADKLAASRATTPATPTETKPETKPDAPATKPARCASCWQRPCDKSGKRCAK